MSRKEQHAIKKWRRKAIVCLAVVVFSAAVLFLTLRFVRHTIELEVFPISLDVPNQNFQAQIVEPTETPIPQTASIPDGDYITRRHKSPLNLVEEIPIADRAEEPYNKNTITTEEYELPKPPVETVEIPENAELVYLGTFYITGYDICMECCGKVDGITASGAQATVGRTVAATKDFAFGTTLYIDGIGARVVEDRGGMKGNHLDVLCEDHPACYAITGYYDVWEVITSEMSEMREPTIKSG